MSSMPETIEEDEPSIEEAAKHFERFMESLGLPRDRSEHLEDTPERVARAYVNELFSGLNEDPKKYLKTKFSEGVEKSEGDAGWVIQDNIQVQSMCSHHFLPFRGRAHVGYIPQEHFVGLSKLARVVNGYSRRPQVQENLTNQIADAIHDELEPLATIVVIEAEHQCMSLRGIKEPHSTTRTSALRGKAHPSNNGDSAHLKNEFMQLVKNGGSI